MAAKINDKSPPLEIRLMKKYNKKGWEHSFLFIISKIVVCDYLHYEYDIMEYVSYE